ncbi:MAG: hypothetical protein KTR31_15915 [Myxococcales bacterium]|nr:hypothetical protein [Myxococcales bacterium]
MTILHLDRPLRALSALSALTLLLVLGCTGAAQVPAPDSPTPEPTSVTPPVAEVPDPEPAAPPPDVRNAPPEGWVDLTEHIPSVRVDIRYHTPNNFTGAPLPGYGHPGAWLQRAPADALKAVQTDLEAKGYSLLVYDAYRPLRGTLGMVAWAERTDQEHLLNGYIARRSGHNKGNTIDLSVVEMSTGDELDMGTPWDTLDERSHTRNATGEALENRLMLRAAMHAHGWRNYSKEWWHYSFAMKGDLRHRDVPYACFEPAEGTWTAPDGWNQPGFQMPMTYDMAPCGADQSTK